MDELLLSKGLDFTVNVLGTAPQSSALTMKANIISLLNQNSILVFQPIIHSLDLHKNNSLSSTLGLFHLL